MNKREAPGRKYVLREKKSRLSKLAGMTTLAILGMINLMESLASAFMAHNRTNRSNLVESYSLLETDACASDGNAEIETTIYRDIVQMKKDGIKPVFRCQVIETILSQYCPVFCHQITGLLHI
jgi:hypothetical protein